MKKSKMNNEMKVLVLGASGATGKLVVSKLLAKGIPTRIVVRESSKLPKEFTETPAIEVIKGNLLEFDSNGYAVLLDGCNVVISCLGHNLTLKGIFGHPKTLVTDAMRNICETIQEKCTTKYKVILMNTVGNMTPAETSILSGTDKAVFALLNKFLPPQIDNVSAANYLLHTVGTNTPKIEWIIVRPDTLFNETIEGPYELFQSPIRSPLSNPGKTSRNNVANFMVALLESPELWKEWVGRMPAVYNKEK